MYLTSSIFNRDLSGRGSGMSPEAVNIQFLLLHKTRRITVRRWGYATHSPSVCFNGGVKVKRQPWNVLSLTFLQLRLCNINVIVCQRGRRQRVNQPFYSTMQEDIATFFLLLFHYSTGSRVLPVATSNATNLPPTFMHPKAECLCPFTPNVAFGNLHDLSFPPADGSSVLLP